MSTDGVGGIGDGGGYASAMVQKNLGAAPAEAQVDVLKQAIDTEKNLAQNMIQALQTGVGMRIDVKA